MICLNVVPPEMVECSKCNKFCCNPCIEKWTKNKQEKTCPNCRRDFAPTRTNNIVLETLRNIMFKCQNCSEEFKYSQHRSHQAKCKGITLICPLSRCGKSGMATEELKPHLLHECKQVNFTCNSCTLVLKREAIEDHYICFKRSVKEKAEDKKLIATLSN